MEYKLICKEKCRERMEKLLDVFGFVKGDSGGEVAVIGKNMISQGWDHPMAIVLDTDRIGEVEEGLSRLLNTGDATHSISDKHMIGKHEEKFVMVDYEEINFFSANSNDVYFHADQSYICRQKLYELEVNLKDKGFIRINKSEIVNIKQVKEIVPWFNSRLILVLSNDQELVVTKSYAKSFKEYIGF